MGDRKGTKKVAAGVYKKDHKWGRRGIEQETHNRLYKGYGEGVREGGTK